MTFTNSSPKVLLITRNFPPLIGGMERLLHHIYLELDKSFRLAIVGPKGCQDYISSDSISSTFPPYPLTKFFTLCHWNAYKLVKDFSPDLIFSGSGVTATSALLAARHTKKPVLCYLHGLDLVEKHPLYRILCVPAIKSCDALLVNSHHTAQLAKTIGINESRIQILHPGVSIPDASMSSTESFRDRFGIGQRPILLSVGRLTKRKGIVEFIERCLPDIVQSHPEVILLIIGGEATQAMNPTYGVLDMIRKTASSHGLNDNVKVLNYVDDETLSQAYFASQLLVFPVIEKPNDVEGFGMVAVEAAAHGLPTVAYAVGGVVDAVKDGSSGYLLNPGDYEGFSDAILRQLRDSQVSKKSCMDFASSFSWEMFGNELRAICSEILARKMSHLS